MNIITLLLIVVGFGIDLLFIINDDKYHNALSILLKTLAALSFVGIGIYGLNYCDNKFLGRLIVLTLIFDMLGDFILILRNIDQKHQNIIFISGTISFMIAHLFLILFFVKLSLISLLIGIIIDACLTLVFIKTLLPKLNVEGITRKIGIVYVSIILLTSSMSIYLFITKINALHILLMIGSLIFTFSDLVLIVQKFGKEKRDFLQPLYRITYFISQVLIALCVSLL